MAEPETLAALRDRLLALRADLIDRLASADTIEPAWLRTLTDTETALATLDRAEDIGAR
jgi:hypothetical protein